MKHLMSAPNHSILNCCWATMMNGKCSLSVLFTCQTEVVSAVLVMLDARVVSLSGWHVVNHIY